MNVRAVLANMAPRVRNRLQGLFRITRFAAPVPQDMLMVGASMILFPSTQVSAQSRKASQMPRSVQRVVWMLTSVPALHVTARLNVQTQHPPTFLSMHTHVLAALGSQMDGATIASSPSTRSVAAYWRVRTWMYGVAIVIWTSTSAT
eukprot:COSAG01_NODE_35395_length_532_cov_1.579677_1_plen_146_part_01